MDMYIYVFISLLLDNANFDFLEFHSTVTFLHYSVKGLDTA